ncbi:MAG TPA: pyridoxamine 5'-phosphate oxidase [Polyangiaceae bacterium]
MLQPNDPFARFEDAFARARAAEQSDPTAMTLATVDASGKPSARIVLLKGVDADGFVFFTNYESRKGVELAHDPRVALCVHWPVLVEQVRVEGSARRIEAAESDAYFASRARESQIGAWASQQSRPLASRAELEARVVEVTVRYAGRPVPRPPFWGGFRVRPERIEFWKGMPSRLHEREVYVREGDGYRVERLYP